MYVITIKNVNGTEHEMSRHTTEAEAAAECTRLETCFGGPLTLTVKADCATFNLNQLANVVAEADVVTLAAMARLLWGMDHGQDSNHFLRGLTEQHWDGNTFLSYDVLDVEGLRKALLDVVITT